MSNFVAVEKLTEPGITSLLSQKIEVENWFNQFNNQFIQNKTEFDMISNDVLLLKFS